MLKGRKTLLRRLVHRWIVWFVIFFRPFSTPNPLRGCNTDSAQYSNNSATPTPFFEDDDEDEDDFDAPCEGRAFFGFVTRG